MKVLLVEDDLLTGKLLSTMLADNRYIVDLATDGQQGFELAEQLDYDLILLDVQLPKLNGIHLCQQLRAKGCATPIMMLTACGDSEDIVQGLDAGADDYMVKPYEPQQLAARVRSLLRRREKAIASPVLQWGDLTLNPLSAEVAYLGHTICLTAKEYSLLELFLRHPQRVFSRSAILDLLWQADDSLVEGTVTNLIKDLRRKLRMAQIPHEVIETLYGLGYRLKAPPTAGPQNKIGPTADSQADAQLLGKRDRSIDLLPELSTIAERFQQALAARIAVLDQALAALQLHQLEPEQRQQAQEEAHQLAGTLSFFGYDQSTAVVRTIEQILQADLQNIDLQSTKRNAVKSADISRLRVCLKQLVASTSIKASRQPNHLIQSPSPNAVWGSQNN